MELVLLLLSKIWRNAHHFLFSHLFFLSFVHSSILKLTTGNSLVRFSVSCFRTVHKSAFVFCDEFTFLCHFCHYYYYCWLTYTECMCFVINTNLNWKFIFHWFTLCENIGSLQAFVFFFFFVRWLDGWMPVVVAFFHMIYFRCGILRIFFLLLVILSAFRFFSFYSFRSFTLFLFLCFSFGWWTCHTLCDVCVSVCCYISIDFDRSICICVRLSNLYYIHYVQRTCCIDFGPYTILFIHLFMHARPKTDDGTKTIFLWII